MWSLFSEHGSIFDWLSIFIGGDGFSVIGVEVGFSVLMRLWGVELTQVMVMLVLEGCGFVVDVVNVVVVVVRGAGCCCCCCWTSVELDEVADAGEMERFACSGFTMSLGLHLAHVEADWSMDWCSAWIQLLRTSLVIALKIVLALWYFEKLDILKLILFKLKFERLTIS